MRANPRASIIFLYPKDELIGQNINVLVPKRDKEKHVNAMADFHKNPEKRPMGAGRDLFGIRKDKVEIPVEIGLNPFRIKNRNFVLASILDITKRKEAEQKTTDLIVNMMLEKP